MDYTLENVLKTDIRLDLTGDEAEIILAVHETELAQLRDELAAAQREAQEANKKASSLYDKLVETNLIAHEYNKKVGAVVEFPYLLCDEIRAIIARAERAENELAQLRAALDAAQEG